MKNKGRRPRVVKKQANMVATLVYVTGSNVEVTIKQGCGFDVDQLDPRTIAFLEKALRERHRSGDTQAARVINELLGK